MEPELNKRLERVENMLATLLQKAGAKATIEDIKEYFTPSPEKLKDLKWEDTTKYSELGPGDIMVEDMKQ